MDLDNLDWFNEVNESNLEELEKIAESLSQEALVLDAKEARTEETNLVGSDAEELESYWINKDTSYPPAITVTDVDDEELDDAVYVNDSNLIIITVPPDEEDSFIIEETFSSNPTPSPAMLSDSESEGFVTMMSPSVIEDSYSDFGYESLDSPPFNDPLPELFPELL